MKMNAAFILGSLLLSGILYAQSTPREALLVLSKKDRTLAIVNAESLKAIVRIPVGNDPHEVIASTDGKTAYVSNYGLGAYNTLAVIDLVAQKPLTPVDLGPLRGPHGLAFVGGKTWFTAETAKAIGSYDPATKKIDWVLGTGQNRTHMIYVSQDLKTIVTSNVNSGTVSIMEAQSGNSRPVPANSQSGSMDPRAERPNGPNGPNGPMRPAAGDWSATVVQVGHGAEGFDVSADGAEIWVANAQDGTISIVDSASKNVTETIAANVMGANRLKFTPDGKLVFISTLSGSDLVIFEAASRKNVKRLRIGRGAAGIVMQPDGSRAYVACTPDGYVAVIDLKSLEIIGQIDAGPQPDGLAWATRH